MAQRVRGERRTRALVTGLLIGGVETVIAISFASLVFVGYLDYFLGEGMGIYLVVTVISLVVFAWRAGSRGVVGGLAAPSAALMSLIASTTAVKAFGSVYPGFLTMVATSLVVTTTCGVVFWVLGRRRRADLIRYVPYPVVGGFIAGTGWLLLRGGIHVSFAESPFYTDLAELIEGRELRLWIPAFAFGVILLLAVRFVKRPLVIPIVIGLGLVAFVGVALANGASLDEVRRGGWLLGPFETTRLWEPWTVRAITGADWWAVLESWMVIVTAVFVAALGLLFNVGGSELILDRDLDTNEELRDAGLLNVVSGLVGGIPGYHAMSLTSLAAGMNVDARRAGLVAAAVPAAAVVFGASAVELIPRMIVGGVLVFLGLSFLVEWVWDKRRSLPRIEYAVVIVILTVIIARGYLAGVVVGLVLAVVLFAVNYGRLDLVSEVAFGQTYRSNVDRSPRDRARLRSMGPSVQILRVSGFVFFGSTSRLLERIRERAEASSPRFLVVDLRRVSGVDSSAVVAFAKVLRLGETYGFETIFTGASEAVRAQLERGGVTEGAGAVFEPDLDRGLERCEDALLAEPGASPVPADPDEALAAWLPEGLAPHLERIEVPAGTVLIRQDDPPGDIYVLAEGQLSVSTHTPEGTELRLRTLRPGVVVGEIALYTGQARTADVIAQTDAVLWRCDAATIERLERTDPEVAAALHRWLATTLADRLHETTRAVDTLLG